MDDLLAGFEGELGIDAETDGGDDFDATQGAAIAAEVNLLKRASESQMEVAMKSELSLQHGESIDQYMPTENVTQIMNNICFRIQEMVFNQWKKIVVTATLHL